MQGNIARMFFHNGLQNLLYPRCFTSSLVIQKCHIHKDKILEKLNLPPRPKKPLSPYFRFMEQVRPVILKEYPDIKATELVKIVAKRWSVVDSKLKEKLSQQYAEENVTYNKLKNQYEMSLTPEQKELIKEALLNESDVKEERKAKRKLKELGKPKKPPGVFLRFLASKLSEKDKHPSVKDWMRAVSQEWKNVSADVKSKLEEQWKCDVDKFNNDLNIWEKRMIKEGNLDVVRKASLAPEPKTKLKK